jgi:hypothetical protein
METRALVNGADVDDGAHAFRRLGRRFGTTG